MGCQVVVILGKVSLAILILHEWVGAKLLLLQIGETITIWIFFPVRNAVAV